MKRKRKPDTFVCPHCGANVPVGARVCRECGSDDETGWAEDADVWGAGISAGYGGDDDFDYDEFVEKEMPGQAAAPPGRSLKVWGFRVVIVILCLTLLRYLFVR